MNNFNKNFKKIIFYEQPEWFIDEYYNNCKNKIDLKCELLISMIKDETEIQNLNQLRNELIEKIDSVKQTVNQRFDKLKYIYTKQMFRDNTQQIKDEIFLDKYFILLDIYNIIPSFEFKLGVILFTEFEDQLLETFK